MIGEHERLEAYLVDLEHRAGEVRFVCKDCGASVRTYRWVNYRTIPPSMDTRDLCDRCKCKPIVFLPLMRLPSDPVDKAAHGHMEDLLARTRAWLRLKEPT
jgi:hypothetical protein